MRKHELLSPAGSLEICKAVLNAGADAVYLGGDKFGARAFAKNFTQNDIQEALDFAHMRGKKIFLTVNTLLKNKEIETELFSYLKPLYEHGLDAVIVQDYGVFQFVHRNFPELALHASTQMSVSNVSGAKFLVEHGAERIVTARELSRSEIRRIYDETGVEIESFIHGALCYCYSGQCLMSSILGGRSGNRGRCAQPCRLPYKTALCGIETADIDERKENTDNKVAGRKKEGRKDENRAAGNRRRGSQKTENERYGNGKQRADRNRKGTGSDSQIAEVCPLSLKDISTIEILPEILNAGVTSLKIEGRMKTALYVATVARTYRKAIDDYFESPKLYRKNMEWYKEQIMGCTYRLFTTGFFYGKPDETSQIYDSNTYAKDYTYLGFLEEKTEKGLYRITQRNKFLVGETIEVMRPDGENRLVTVKAIYDEEGNSCDSAPHPQQVLYLDLGEDLNVFDLLRRKESVS